MNQSTKVLFVFSLALSAASSVVLRADRAFAQPTDPGVAAEATALSDRSGSYRHKANDWMIGPQGSSTLSGSMRFLTADAFGDSKLKFTDVALVSIAASTVLTRRLVVHASQSFLLKQPSYTDESIWQSGSVGARLGFGKRYALSASGQAGELLSGGGKWAAATMGVQARKSLHPTTLLEGGMAAAYTGLFVDGVDAPSWVTEAVISGQLIFRVPNGMFAGWLGSEIRFPMVKETASMGGVGGMAYDPQTRVNVELGTVMSYIDDWDIFAKIVIVDRGDSIDARTTLPILEGGFDQTHIIVGLTRRFKRDDNRQNQSLGL